MSTRFQTQTGNADAGANGNHFSQSPEAKVGYWDLDDTLGRLESVAKVITREGVGILSEKDMDKTRKAANVFKAQLHLIRGTQRRQAAYYSVIRNFALVRKIDGTQRIREGGD